MPHGPMKLIAVDSLGGRPVRRAEPGTVPGADFAPVLAPAPAPAPNTVP
ncbi:hypothetical protein [Streptomyces sp. NPDC005423]